MGNPTDIVLDSAEAAALQAAQDYTALRSLGISLISALGSAIWTDYNVHDPGITMLEVFTYAMTDLGYRTAFPMEDILAEADAAELNAHSLYTAAQILPNTPVTFNDFRKLIIDQVGVSNAWVTVGNPFEAAEGLRKIIVQASNPQLSLKEEKDLRHRISDVFARNRNLGEVLQEITFLKPQNIVLQLQMIVQMNASPETVMASALVAIGGYLEGQVEFYTLNEMLARMEGDVTAVFEGPLLNHGFIADADLEAQVRQVQPDALIRCIRDMAGVESIVMLGILPQMVRTAVGNQYMLQTLNPDGSLNIGAQYYPILGADLSSFKLSVMQGRKPYALDMTRLQHEIDRIQNLQAATKKADAKMDFPIPVGKKRDLAHYYSIQYDFPAMYDLGPEMDGEAMTAEVAQMRGYLVLMDQVLANYLSQLAHVYKLFSWDPAVAQTYYTQGLEDALQDMAQLLVGMPSLSGRMPTAPQSKLLADGLLQYRARLAQLRESRQEFLYRRPQFLNHLLARFGRSLELYVQQLPQGDPETQPQYYINTIQRMLADYPALSSQRGAGGDPYMGKPGIADVISLIFGLPAEDARDIANYERFKITNARAVARKNLFGQLVMSKEHGGPVDMAALMRLGTQRQNYHYTGDHLQPGSVGLSLWSPEISETSGGTYNFVNSYPDYESADAAIAQSVKLFHAFSRASERLYFIDHILLKPFPDDPVHGLRLLGTSGTPDLATVSWYPLGAIELAGELSSSNSVIAWGAPLASPSESLDAGSPPSPGAPQFTFTVTAWQDGQPYPVYPPNGLPLPGGFETGSKVVSSVYLSQAMRAYVLNYDATTLENEASLGQQLTQDFQLEALPANWVSAGKAETLEEWGRYALYYILLQWQSNYGAYPDFEAALTDVCFGTMPIGPGNANSPAAPFVLSEWLSPPMPASPPDWLSPPVSASPPDWFSPPAPSSPPDSRERLLLVGFIRGYYAQYASSGLLDALLSDLGPSLEPKKLSDIGARAWLACTGRALGATYLATYYPELRKEQLGSAVALGHGLSTAVNLEAELEKVVVDFLGVAAGGQLSFAAGTAFLQAWLQVGGDIGNASMQMQLQASGLQLWTVWMDALSPQQEPQPADYGWLLGIYLAANPLGPETLGSPANLAAMVPLQVAEYMGFPYLPASNYQAFARMPSLVNVDGLFASSPPSAVAGTLERAMRQAIAWYVRNVLSAPGQGGAAATQLRSQLGLDAPMADQSLWQDGDVAIAYYCQQMQQNTAINALPLGEQLMGLMAGDAYAQPSDATLATIGAFTLTRYLDAMLLGSSTQNATVGSLLYAQYASGGAVSQPMPTQSSPPENVPQDAGLAWMPNLWSTPPMNATALISEIYYSQNQYLARITKVAANNWLSGPCVLNQAVNEANVAQFLKCTLPPTANTSVALEMQLSLFKAAQNVHQLSLNLLSTLSGVGRFYINCYLRNRFPWQWSDAVALGNAVLQVAAKETESSPANSANTAATSNSPVQYAISLGYMAGEIPVNLRSEGMWDAQADVLKQIALWQAAIPKVKSGAKDFGEVFEAFYYPVVDADQNHDHARIAHNPYSNMLTVIGPDWPLRFQEKGFQDQVEQAVQHEAPAHFLTHCLWLSKQEMQVFETAYNHWISRRSHDAARDFHGQQILRFILQHLIPSRPTFQVSDSYASSATA